MTDLVKIAVYVPVTHAETIRKAMTDAGAGCVGAYDACSFSVRGTGRFRPGKNANPFIGKAGELEEVEEERIETVCEKEKLPRILEAVKKVHPYEEPAIDIYPLLSPNSLPQAQETK